MGTLGCPVFFVVFDEFEDDDEDEDDVI